MIAICKCGHKNLVRFRCNVKQIKKFWVVFNCYSCQRPIIVYSFVNEKNEQITIARFYVEPDKKG